MLKYTVIRKLKELPYIAEEYEEQLGIKLSDYRKYQSVEKQWENVIVNMSDNCKYEDIRLKMYIIINEVINGNYVNNKDNWKEILAFFKEQIEHSTLYYNDIFLNAYFSINYLENRKNENKNIGIGSHYLSAIDFEIPIEHELNTVFCRK